MLSIVSVYCISNLLFFTSEISIWFFFKDSIYLIISTFCWLCSWKHQHSLKKSMLIKSNKWVTWVLDFIVSCNPGLDPNYILFRVLANNSISPLSTHSSLAIAIWLRFAKSPLITSFLFKTFNDWVQRTKIQQEKPTMFSSLMDFQM